MSSLLTLRFVRRQSQRRDPLAQAVGQRQSDIVPRAPGGTTPGRRPTRMWRTTSSGSTTGSGGTRPWAISARPCSSCSLPPKPPLKRGKLTGRSRRMQTISGSDSRRLDRGDPRVRRKHHFFPDEDSKKRAKWSPLPAAMMAREGLTRPADDPFSSFSRGVTAPLEPEQAHPPQAGPPQSSKRSGSRRGSFCRESFQTARRRRSG